MFDKRVRTYKPTNWEKLQPITINSKIYKVSKMVKRGMKENKVAFSIYGNTVGKKTYFDNGV